MRDMSGNGASDLVREQSGESKSTSEESMGEKGHMSFTDSDLKRLKEYLGRLPIMAQNDIEAILVRLEAAEAIAKWCDEIPHEKHNGLYDAWRKSKGE